VIRANAVKCRHCGSEIEPAQMRQYASHARNNPWHMIVLVLLLVITGFVAGYPALVNYLDERALVKAMVERANAAPPPAPLPAPAPTPPPVVAAPVDTSEAYAGLRRLNFGEDAEVVVGKTYSGSIIADLFEQNAYQTHYDLESTIMVEFAGNLYEVRTRQPRFFPGGQYKIVSIEEK